MNHHESMTLRHQWVITGSALTPSVYYARVEARCRPLTWPGMTFRPKATDDE